MQRTVPSSTSLFINVCFTKWKTLAYSCIFFVVAGSLIGYFSREIVRADARFLLVETSFMSYDKVLDFLAFKSNELEDLPACVAIDGNFFEPEAIFGVHARFTGLSPGHRSPVLQIFQPSLKEALACREAFVQRVSQLLSGLKSDAEARLVQDQSESELLVLSKLGQESRKEQSSLISSLFESEARFYSLRSQVDNFEILFDLDIDPVFLRPRLFISVLIGFALGLIVGVIIILTDYCRSQGRDYLG